MKTGYSLSNRIMAFLLSVIMVLGMVPVNAIATGDTDGYGTVEALTEGITLTGTAAETRAVFAGTLSWVAADPSIGRMADGWWIGLKVIAPANVDLEKAQYARGGTVTKFVDVRESADGDEVQYMTLWVLANEEYLRDANLTDGEVNYNYSFDWDGDEVYEQTLKIAYDAKQTVLKDASDNVVYPAPAVGYGSVTTLSEGGTVSGSETANVGVTFANATFAWHPADPSIGRNQDGWWCGLKITAPAGITEEQVKNAQYISGSNTKSFWTYKDSADTDAVHYLTMWVAMNDVMNGTMAPYTYQFDWNNDGIFEQKITVTVDASSVVLKKDGVQQYPALGEVESIFGGTVTGNTTGDVSVLVSNLNLNWSPADESIGRTQGWWAGIHVKAPAGLDAETLQSAVMQRKNNMNSPEWSADMSFWTYKDSADDAATHFVGLWFSVTEASLQAARDENRYMTYFYRFDWNGDGTYEQTVRFSVDPNGSIILNKQNQTGFVFADPNPKDVWVGEGSFPNAAAGGQGDGEITYQIIAGDEFADIDAATGELTNLKAGTVTVQATKAGDSQGFYNQADATYTVTFVKKNQEPQFEISNPSAQTYEPGLTFNNKIIDDQAYGTVTYQVIAGEDVASVDADGKLTVLKAGTVTVQATVSGNEQYNSIDVCYTLNIEKADQPDFALENVPNKPVWTADVQNALTTVGALTDGKVIWNITEGTEVASVDADGKITLHKAGTFTITAQQPGNECYNDSVVVPVTIEVERAVRTGFGFEKEGPITIVFNDDGNVFSNFVINYAGDGEKIYTIIEGETFAEIKDPHVSKLNILGAGTVVVQCVQKEDDRYKEAVDTYTLIIEKDDQTVSFANEKEYATYGIKTYSNVPTSSELHSSKELVYSISENTIGASIDPATGVLSFTDSVDKIGSVTVTVTRPEDDNYKECHDTYTLYLTYEPTPADPYTLEGNTLNASGWYTGNVTIKAPAGYQISTAGNLTNDSWDDEITYSTEGINNFNVFLKNTATGGITDAVPVTELKLDKTKPENLTIVYKDLVSQTIMNQIFFISKENVVVEFSAEDLQSGIAKMEYSLDGGETYTELTAEGGVYSIVVMPKYRQKIALRVTDVAGNVVSTLDDTDTTNDNITLVVDGDAPQISCDLGGVYVEQDGIYHTKDEVFPLNVTVKDDNYDLRAAEPVVKVNDTVQELVWTSTATEGQAVLELTEEGHHNVTVDFVDCSGRVAEQYKVTVYVDRTAPEIEYNFTGTYNDHNGIYHTKDGLFPISFTVKDGNYGVRGENPVVRVNGTVQELIWTSNDTEGKTILELTEEGHYDITVDFTDRSGNVAKQTKFTVYVDRTAPEIDAEFSGAYHVHDGIYHTKDAKFPIGFTVKDGNYAVRDTEPVVKVNGTVQELVWTGTDEGKAVLELTEEGHHDVTVDFVDCSGNVAEQYKVTVYIDRTAPEIEYNLDGVYVDYQGIYHTKDTEFPMSFTVKDGNYGVRGQNPVVKVNGTVQEMDWTSTATEGKADLALTEEGHYDITVDFTDRSGNVAKQTKFTVYVDRTAPEIDAEFNGVYQLQDGIYHTKDAEFPIGFTVKDGNYAVRNTEPVVKVNGIVQELDWTGADTEGKAVLKLTEEGHHDVTVDFVDCSGNVAQQYKVTVYVDRTVPEIEYKLEGVYVDQDGIYHTKDAKFPISFTVKDGNYGVRGENPVVKVNGTAQELDWTSTDTEGKAILELTEEGHYDITVDFTDRSGNVAKQTKFTVYVDRTAPNVEITYSNTNLKDQVVDDPDTVSATTVSRQTEASATANTRFVYDGKIVATITVEEINFYAEDFVILVDGTKVSPDGKWVSAGTNKWKNTVTVKAEGDHVITVEKYQDRAGNVTQWMSGEYTDNTGSGTYTSNVHTIDKTAPVIAVTYDNNTVSNTTFYNANRTATIRITDRNFRPNEVVLTVTDLSAAGADTAYTAPAVTGWDAWTYMGNDIWQTTVSFQTDANINLSLGYTDIAQLKAAAYTAAFTVDKTNPQDLKVTYSDGYANFFEEIIDKVTFGVFYYKTATEVKLTATDLTAGLDYFVINAKQGGSDGATTIDLPVDLKIGSDGTVISGVRGDISNIKVTHEKGVMTVTFNVPKEFRGEFFFEAVDMAGYSTKLDDNNIVVVDEIAPTRTVTFAPTKMMSTDAMADVNNYGESAAVVMYYNKSAVATIRVEEANFFPEDIVLTVNGKTVKTDNGWTNVKDEDGNVTDVWEATVTVSAEGDYVLAMTYTDRSSNEMVKYESQRIVIDKTAPTVSVVYSNTDVKNTVDGRDYFDKAQTATITITDKNFRADDVQILVTAKNVIGEDVMKVNSEGYVESYAAQGKNRGSWSGYAEDSWRREDNKYILTLTFEEDANYTLDVIYRDIASNAAATYETDKFTVDKTAPTDLKVVYDTHVFQEILEAVTFGYYNAQTKVTISAEDETSGIYHFAYSYINSEGVSDVNAELLDQSIQAAEITYKDKEGSASFTIPKKTLTNAGQFNGTISFTAYDRAENNTEKEDETRIVVDSISPTANVTYNPAVKDTDGISYYDGNIEVTVNITEANFDSADVQVTVTKDDANYPVNVTWVDNSVDSHTGTFTLTEDGDYTVSVQYRDKSSNLMNAYTSHQLTLDTTAPTVQVSGIRSDSANKDEKVGFVVTFSDINIDVTTMKPVLLAVMQDEEGVYTSTEIPMGDPEVVEEGKTYTFTVENLPEDALYTLSYEVSDMSGNSTNTAVLEDGEEHVQVQFSVNREGSTFGFGDEYIQTLVNQYYVYEVYNDIIIVEVNVDPIDNYTVLVNGEELVEGQDFVSEQVTEAGKWSKRTYVISKDVFAEEGEYNLLVHSVDKADSAAYSDVKDLAISFVVDQTAPMITVSGLAEGGRYQTDEQLVTLIPSDEGGRLNSLKVVIFDADGQPLKDESGNDISLRFEMSGEELLTYLEENDGKVTFTVPEGLNNQVQIICDDCAVNADGQTNTYDETFTKVTVSQSQLVIFYANKPLFYGTVGGSASIIALIIALLKRKKRVKA